jgi:CHAT domain-containing protein
LDTSVLVLDKCKVLQLLRSGTIEERVRFVQELPANPFKEQALMMLLGSGDRPGMPLLALAPLILNYCYGQDPRTGAVLAEAAHERAVEVWESAENHGLLLATTLSGLADAHAKALSLLGRYREEITALDRYIVHYTQLGECENLPSLRVLRIEAMVNLGQIDRAAEALEDLELLRHPIAGIEARRLKARVDAIRRAPTALRTESSKIDSTDPKQFKKQLQILRDAEALLTRGGGDSDVALRGKVRDASAIFVHGTLGTEQIRQSLATLRDALAWAQRQGVTDLINEALWGIHLCQGRLKQSSEAADALIQLRGNLESIRSGVSDPMQRGGIFGAYRYLFNAMCEHLQKAGRARDLLEAIEASKGRVIADRLTEERGTVIRDSAIYDCIARLPDLCREFAFHYLTVFVDDECLYAVLVSKSGEVRTLGSVPVSSAAVRDAGEAVNPARWGQPMSWAPSSKYADASCAIKPLVDQLEQLLQEGVIEEGDHVCYCSDEDLHNVPLHYLRLRDGIMLNHFSVSRVHSAFDLDRLLLNRASRPREYAGFVVPLSQDLERPEVWQMLADMEAPIHSLHSHKLRGTCTRLADATAPRVLSQALDQRIVHFSTHGWYPATGNPYRESYLLLADENGLPDREMVLKGLHSGRLTPHDIVAARPNLSGSHVSMMACLSGLAKEGVAGDTLGLDWSLIQCGASSLISTHWEVSAACAARYFEMFYAKWLGGRRSRASAWREAMLELMDGDYSSQSLQRWSAFSLTGDFR